jgi:hypothetical protein
MTRSIERARKQDEGTERPNIGGKIKKKEYGSDGDFSCDDGDDSQAQKDEMWFIKGT